MIKYHTSFFEAEFKAEFWCVLAEALFMEDKSLLDRAWDKGQKPSTHLLPLLR